MTMQAAQRQSAAEPRERDPFAAFVGDEMTRAALIRIAAERNWPDVHILRGGVVEAVEILPTMPTPRLVVLDLSDSADPVVDVTQLANVCDEGTRVIALGKINDIALFRDLVDLGVDDYVLKPVSSEVLGAAIDRAAKPVVQAGEAARGGRLIAVTGARGGAGATSVAVNLAWLIAHDQDRKVALVDFDLHFGTVALTLDLEVGRGFADAIENPERIDGLFMERTMVRATDNLFVLASDQGLDRACDLHNAALDPMLERLRADFGCVVADLPRRVSLGVPGVLAAADTVLVVTDLTLAGMRDGLRMVDFIKAQRADADIRLVVNRSGQTKKGEMTPAEFERSVEARVAAILPFDPAATAKSARLGRPLTAVAPKSRFVKGLLPLSRDVSGLFVATKAPLWRRLIKRSA